MSSSFRHPDTNVRFTSQLFWDRQQLMLTAQKTREPLYTLHHDKPGLINFRRVYVELADPTGYKIANKLLEDYSHWQMLMKQPWFREAKELWDQELDAKLKSEGLEAIRMFADGIEGVAPAVQLTAARYLADSAHRKTKAAPRGRPSKEEVSGELKREATESSDMAADLARIRSIK